ncbi:hypothetical protein DPEC_G00242520 [Dallia pectoralis]|uniref:Uncharacterized protein n=1 Tax=Dallia pectoralis TaxID=75939 RepID=A0ACC2FV20_DALPE|nr:hypothetical protein DPEC_G00242520 [Dallia pectoralis]
MSYSPWGDQQVRDENQRSNRTPLQEREGQKEPGPRPRGVAGMSRGGQETREAFDHRPPSRTHYDDVPIIAAELVAVEIMMEAESIVSSRRHFKHLDGPLRMKTKNHLSHCLDTCG